MYSVVVIGAGVAGLMAAGTAAQNGAKRVLLLEKMEKPARKLRITGKGRCNITNTKSNAEFLQKVNAGAEFVDYALQQFDSKAVVAFLDSIGLATAVERGERIFPQSGRAQDVANALERWAKNSGVEIRCNAPVTSVNIKEGAIESVTVRDVEVIDCDAVIVTTGGVSYPLTGSDGDGYQWAADAGHSIVGLRPALVPLITFEDVTGLSGLQLRNVAIKLLIDGSAQMERFGDVDFYDNSIAGATILQVSRKAVDAIIDGKTVAIELDLKAALSLEKLTNRINRELATLKSATLKILLQKLTPSPLHKMVAANVGISLKTPLASLSQSDVTAIASTLKCLKFAIADYCPFTQAIVTAGGVATGQCDRETMQSQFVKKLYFAGEILDIDADTGGYNIQLALSTGRLAGHLR